MKRGEGVGCAEERWRRGSMFGRDVKEIGEGNLAGSGRADLGGNGRGGELDKSAGEKKAGIEGDGEERV